MLRWALAVVVCVGCRVSGPTREHCREAIRARSAESVTVCRAVYNASELPQDGALLARALVARKTGRDEVAALASTIGDKPGGGDAWRAYGDLLVTERELGRATEAYRHAFDSRAATDHRSRARDAIDLVLTYGELEQEKLTLELAGIAYSEAKQVSDLAVRGEVVSIVGGILYNLGDLPAVEDLLRESDGALTTGNPYDVHIRNLEGIVAAARSRRQLADLAFLDVIAIAQKRGLDDVALQAKLNRIGIAVDAGDAEAAAALLESSQLPPDASATTRQVYLRARVHELRGRHTESLATLDTIATSSEMWTARVAADRGRALARLGRAREAETELLRALEYVERVRNGIGLDALKPWWVRDWRQTFDDLFLLYVREQRFADALGVVQRATARSFIDGLAAAEPASTDATFARAARRLEGLRSLIRSTRLSPASIPGDAKSLIAAVGSRRVISFYVAEGRLWRIATRDGETPAIEAVAPLEELTASIEAFAARPQDRQRARELGARLFPLHVLPAPGTTLYVALAEPIAHVAIAALVVDDAYLVQRHAIARVPNLAVLAHLAQQPREGAAPIVIGDATNDLAEARAEADAVARSLGVKPFVGATATTALLASARPRVLHIGTHARPTPAGPALVLADGLATAGDIVDRGVSADVVVLTSCAAADPLDRDELGALSSAFLAAGSHAVVAASWSVEDVHARVFAEQFYAAHGDATPITATAIAQRRMIEAGLPTSAWAVFVAFGDERSRAEETR